MKPSPPEKKILVVDDDRGLLRLIEKTLLREGFLIATAGSAAEAESWLASGHADLMLLDLKLADGQGPELVRRLTQAHSCPDFIIITGQGDERVAVEMMKAGAMDYVVKDAEFLQLLPTVVRRGVQQVEKEQRLRQVEQEIHLIRSAVEQGYSSVMIADTALPDPHVLYVNPAFAQATGIDREHIVGKPLSAISSLSAIQHQFQAGWPESAAFLEGSFSFPSPMGERWAEWRVSPVKDKGGHTVNWLLIFREITERKRLEREILEIGDLERQRIGQDLHDGLCQQLAGIELMSQVLEQKLSVRSKTDAARAGEISRFVREAISQTRSLARGLSPLTLESDGLESGLRELAANTEKMFGVVCRLLLQGELPNLALAGAIHLYRIAQEAVSNAIKHGKATRIELVLVAEPHRTQLAVQDNGAGFTTIPAGARGMGLRIMQYRAGMIGGTLAIAPLPDGGIRVTCSVPREPSRAQSG
jgi:PAS domain S-box-containing protein